MVTLAIMRVEWLKNFFKQFVLVEDSSSKSAKGILNYEETFELLQREINKSERYNFPVSIILLEINKNTSQKEIEFLEVLQATVKRSIRETDVFGLWEPELTPVLELKLDNSKTHFICMLPHTKFKEAYDLSERFRLKLLRRLSLDDDVDVRLADLDTTDLDVQEFATIVDPIESTEKTANISCGIAQLEYYEGIELFLERGGVALDMAKTKGGNCTMPQPAITDVVVSDIAKHLN